jgi:hypothetical protein
MFVIDHFPARGIFLCVFVAIASLGAPAQMTLFNIPSTDTLPRGSFYVEADLITKPVSYRNGGFQSYGYRVVYGVDHKTEVGANYFYTGDGGEPSGELSVSVKRNVYSNEKHGVAVSGGAIAFLPLKAGPDGHKALMVYGNVSKVITPLHGLRVTGGFYKVFGGGRDFGTKTGVLLGVEQPIAKKFSFIGDWSSGNNRFGFATAGVNYAITTRQFVMVGYNFGNYGRGNNALAAFYGYTFK